jgi:hypothetical protein
VTGLPASGCTRQLSIGGFPVGVAVRGAFEHVRGRPDVWLGRLQDRVPARTRPGRECLAKVAVPGVFGGDGQALPVGEPLGERAVRGGQFVDPLAHLAWRLARGEGELGVLGFGGGFGFGGAERGEMLARVAAAQFGVGGDGQVALGSGGGVPVGTVGHHRGEYGLALPVGLVQGVVAGGEFLLASGGVLVAVLAGCCGFGSGAQAGQAGLAGGARTWRSLGSKTVPPSLILVSVPVSSSRSATESLSRWPTRLAAAVNSSIASSIWM